MGTWSGIDGGGRPLWRRRRVLLVVWNLFALVSKLVLEKEWSGENMMCGQSESVLRSSCHSATNRIRGYNNHLSSLSEPIRAI